MDALTYMQINKLPQKKLQSIIDHFGDMLPSQERWDAFLTHNGIVDDRHRQIATEGALIGSILDCAISDNLVVVSDDAGQFNVLCHALCWVHAERLIGKIVPYTDQARDDLENIKDQLWNLYKDLKAYKRNPHSEAQARRWKRHSTRFSPQKQPAQPLQ